MKDPHQKAQDHEISLQLLNTDQKEDVQKEHDWLSNQFSRLHFMIYKLWLVLTFIIALSIQPNLILSQFKDLEDKQRVVLIMLSVSSIFALFSCGEMLFAIMRRKSAFAQKSLVKLQYSIIGAVIGFSALEKTGFDFNKSFLFEKSVGAALPLSILGSIFGGFAVIQTFKSNHPLERLKDLQEKNELAEDLLNQNEAIISELSKYDEQLERCPYKVYKFWLKLAMMMEILIICSIPFYAIQSFWESKQIVELGQGFFILILSSLGAFCCYEMEAVLITKMLERSKKVLLHLKINIFMSILIPVLRPIFFDRKFLTLENLGVGVFFSFVPLITLIGAFCIHKIIEQRDQFAKFSSYSGDHYL